MDEEIATAQDRIKVVALQVIAGTMGPQSATLTLDMGGGKQETVHATGNGPVDATFNAIIKLVPHKAKLALYQVHAVTEGTDAQAEVSVRLEDEADEGGRAVTRARPIPTRWWRRRRPISARSTSCSPSAAACTRRWVLRQPSSRKPLRISGTQRTAIRLAPWIPHGVARAIGSTGSPGEPPG